MKNPFSYQGKRVVITGAYSGVGAAAVELLSSLDASEIIALDIKKPDGPITRLETKTSATAKKPPWMCVCAGAAVLGNLNLGNGFSCPSPARGIRRVGL